MHIFGSDAYFYNTACHIINMNKTPDILYYYLLRSRGLYARTLTYVTDSYRIICANGILYVLTLCVYCIVIVLYACMCLYCMWLLSLAKSGVRLEKYRYYRHFFFDILFLLFEAEQPCNKNSVI
jgi:hypothetical protein